MNYIPGEEICISIDALVDEDSHMDYVKVASNHDGDGKFYMLYNEFGELCCLDGEYCVVDHIVVGTTDVYDLVNYNGQNVVHFMMDKHDLDIATFK